MISQVQRSAAAESQFNRLVALVRRRGGDIQRGRPWRWPLEDRVLLVATYWRTNLTLRQVAPPFGISKSAADRILDHLAPLLAISPAHREREATVHIIDGIGSLTRLIGQAAITAIHDGTERITKNALDAIRLDHLAEQHRRPTRRR